LLGYVTSTAVDKILGSSDPNELQHPFTDSLSLIRTVYVGIPPKTDEIVAYINQGTTRNAYTIQSMLRRYCQPARLCGDFPIAEPNLYGILYVAEPLYFNFKIESGQLGVLGVVGATGGFAGVIVGTLAFWVGLADKFFEKYYPEEETKSSDTEMTSSEKKVSSEAAAV
jgi:hypothetical protein